MMFRQPERIITIRFIEAIARRHRATPRDMMIYDVLHTTSRRHAAPARHDAIAAISFLFSAAAAAIFFSR